MKSAEIPKNASPKNNNAIRSLFEDPVANFILASSNYIQLRDYLVGNIYTSLILYQTNIYRL